MNIRCGRARVSPFWAGTWLTFGLVSEARRSVWTTSRGTPGGDGHTIRGASAAPAGSLSPAAGRRRAYLEERGHTLDTTTTAAALAARGWPVFPVRLVTRGGKTEKRPLLRAWQTRATTSPGELDWSRADAVGVALPVGVVALDVDDVAAFAAAGLDLPVDGPGQRTPSGGYHRLFRTDGREVRQTVKELPGADTRVGGKGFLVAWEQWEFSPGDLPPAAEIMYAARAGRDDRQGERGGAEPLGTRAELLSLAGALRASGLEEEDIYGVLARMRNDGRIVDLDPAWPWTAQDLKKIAQEAGRWAPGHAPPPAPVVRLRRRDGTAVEPAPDDPWLGSVVLDDVDDAPQPPLLLGRVHPTGHTILYGTGGAGKGVVAAQWVADLTAAGTRVLVLDYEQNPAEWRRRVTTLGGDARLVRYAEPLGPDWTGKRGPLWRVVEQLAALRAAWEAGLVVVDSIAVATAGTDDPYAPDSPARYAAALQRLGAPVLSLAHVNRGDDARYPFGSVFWHNLARLTWSLEEQDDGSRVLTNRKVNSYVVTPPRRIAWDWVDQDLPSRLEEEDVKESTQVRVAAALLRLGRPAGVDAIHAAVLVDGGEAVTKSGIVKALQRHSHGQNALFRQPIPRGPWELSVRVSWKPKEPADKAVSKEDESVN